MYSFFLAPIYVFLTKASIYFFCKDLSSFFKRAHHSKQRDKGFEILNWSAITTSVIQRTTLDKA